MSSFIFEHLTPDSTDGADGLTVDICILLPSPNTHISNFYKLLKNILFHCEKTDL